MISEKDRTRNFVSLRIRSEFLLPEDLENMIGMKADKLWRIGDLRGKTIIKEKMNGLLVHSRLDKREDVDRHCRDIFSLLTGHEAVLKKLSLTNLVEITCAIYADEISALYFDKDLVQYLAEIGACLDVDLYLVPPVSD